MRISAIAMWEQFSNVLQVGITRAGCATNPVEMAILVLESCVGKSAQVDGTIRELCAARHGGGIFGILELSLKTPTPELPIRLIHALRANI